MKQKSIAYMSPKAKRRAIDFVFGLFVFFSLSMLAWWAPVVALVHGLWNFYDGATRFGLSDE